METAKLTAVLSRGVTGLQSQSLDLPEFDDQSTFAATQNPTQKKKQFFRFVVLPKSGPNETPSKYIKEFFSRRDDQPCPKSPEPSTLSWCADQPEMPGTNGNGIQFVVLHRKIRGVDFCSTFLASWDTKPNMDGCLFVLLFNRQEFWVN